MTCVVNISVECSGYRAESPQLRQCISVYSTCTFVVILVLALHAHDWYQWHSACLLLHVVSVARLLRALHVICRVPAFQSMQKVCMSLRRIGRLDKTVLIQAAPWLMVCVNVICPLSVKGVLRPMPFRAWRDPRLCGIFPFIPSQLSVFRLGWSL